MPKPKYRVILDLVLGLKATGLYYGRWIKGDVLVQLIEKHSSISHYSQMSFSTSVFNNALGRLPFVDTICTPNELGIFRKCVRRRVKNVETDKMQFKKFYYFYIVRQINSIPPNIVSLEDNAVDTIQYFYPHLHPNTTRLHPRPNTNITPFSTNSIQPVTKRQRVDNSKYIPKSEKIKAETKWDSPEALALFLEESAPREKKRKRRTRQNNNQTQQDQVPPKIDVKKHVAYQIQLLRRAHMSPNGWKSIISDTEADDLCTPHDVFNLRLKARYLAATLSHALVLYESTADFLDICKRGIQTINETDGYVHDENNDEKIIQIHNPRTIMEWLRIFRRTSSFPNPAVVRQCHWKNKLPAIFQNNPDLHQSLVSYARANLATLSGELIHQYLFNTAIPGIVTRVQRETGQEYTTAQFLKDNNLTTLSLSTVYNWLGLLGFTYSLSRKSYYVDSHEKPENTKYRANFIRRYEAYELRTYRWVQLPICDYNNLVQTGELSETCGYKYKNNKGEDYVELHVDDHPVFQDDANDLPFGGNLSVRKEEGVKPLMIIGQDECIFKQYSLVKKSWSDPDGMRPLLPKDDGRGLMISSFVSRELGYGYNLNSEQLDKVNRERMRNDRKKYKDESAATLKNGSSVKRRLTSTPFTRILEYGANSEGYWTYDAMVLQLEDCVDALQILFPQFDFIFLFDHSNGHDRMQPDGLNMRKMNKLFGGQQPKMRPSTLMDKGCFGPHHTEAYKLQPGDTQSMVFESTDPGPFYLDTIQKEKRRLDEKTGKMITKVIPKTRLIQMLKDMNILNPVGNLKHLQAQCSALDLPVTYTEEKILEGWVGKPKGSLQVLYERGWIDPEQWRMYTDKGRMDEMGILMEHTSLNLLMQKQSDFATELTLLQFYCCKMGATVDRTPKCHPELAGEGIEYIWAMAKLYYRHQPLARKRSKAKFIELVHESLSGCNITLGQVRKCSRRAREYIIAYKVFDQVKCDIHSTQHKDGMRGETECNESVQLNFDLIEKTIKAFKTHRNVADIDVSFIKGLKLDRKKEEFVKDVVSRMKASF
jgi:hypothetical protein